MFALVAQRRTTKKIIVMEQKLSPAQMQKFISILNEVERYRNLSDLEKEKLIVSILERPYMDFRCDWAFKHVLENKEILKMLLNDFLPEEIDTVSFLPNEIDKMRPDDKNVIMDVLCESKDGRKFIVEMQRKKRSLSRTVCFTMEPLCFIVNSNRNNLIRP